MFSKPLRILSLWDIMNHFGMHHFYSMALLFHLSIHYLTGRKQDLGGDAQASDDEVKSFFENPINLLKAECEKYELKETSRQIDNASYLKSKVLYPLIDRSYTILFTIMTNLNVTLLKELESRKFLWVSDQLTEFYEKNDLFGEEVNDRFPSARGDIKEAGNCLVAGCNTAAVFHLMRVVEWGLRALAYKFGPKTMKELVKKKGNPISYEQWGEILKEVELRIKAKVGTMKRGQAKQSTEEFYYPLLQDINAFNDAYRKHIAHTRREYNQVEAESIFRRVKDFMNRLSGRVREV
jgi:hypothetical protein